MRQLLSTAIALSCAAFLAGTAVAGETGHGVLVQDPSKAPFTAVPGVPACVTMAPLHGNLATGPATAMVKMTKGCMVPFHWHTPSEELIVLKGRPYAQMMGEKPKYLETGSYSQLPSKHVHRFRCESEGDCILVLVADAAFDIQFVDEAGKPISTEAAIKAAEAPGATNW